MMPKNITNVPDEFCDDLVCLGEPWCSVLGICEKLVTEDQLQPEATLLEPEQETGGFIGYLE